MPKVKIKRKFDFKLSDFKSSKKVKKTKTNKETGASNTKSTKESENKQTQLEPETVDKQIALADTKGATTVTNGELIDQIQKLAAKGIFMEHVLSKALRSVPPVQRDGKLWRKLNLTTITTPKTSDTITDESVRGPEENDAETSTILQGLEENLKDAVKPDAQALQGLTKKMSEKRNAPFAQRSLAVVAKILKTASDQNHNVKRKALRTLVAVGTTFPERSGETTSIIIQTVIDHHDKQKVVTACKAALENIFAAHRLPVASYIREEMQRKTQMCARTREILKKTLGEWQLKAAKYLSRAPIKAEMWHDVIKSIEKNSNKAKEWQEQWTPEHGHVQWVNSGDDRAITTPDTTVMTHASWNVNGLKGRWRSGELVQFIMRYKPTTLFLSEIKTDLASMQSPWELKHVLQGLGYVHCVWNWCITKSAEGHKGSGNFGTAVFSQVPLSNVRFGIGHESLDKEGRVITAEVGDDAFIWSYVPCSRWDDEEHRSIMRKEYDSRFFEYYGEVQTVTTGNVFSFGDHNIAPTNGDCSSWMVKESVKP